MIRSLVFIGIVLLSGLVFAWLADRPGEILINWQNQQIELSLISAMSLILALIVSVMVIWWVIRLILTSPEIMSKYFKIRKKDRGYKALSQGLIAAGAGDTTRAKKLAVQSKNLLDNETEPLIHLLEVQTAMIDGRDEDARQSLQKMADTPDTAILGLRGLYLEAKRLGASEAARQYALKAADLAPHLSWASDASIEYCAQENNWDEAIDRLEKQRVAGVISTPDAKRKKAVLLTGRAMARSDGELSEISSDALLALSLAPDLVPAATIAAKALFRQGKIRKGAKILEKIWRERAHPHVAEVYIHARVGDSSGDRLKRAQHLESLKNHHVESLFIVAKTALENHDYKLARQKAAAAARLDPREGMYLLLADIEEAETSDQGRVRHWLACAVRANPDPKWTADGYVSEKWAPFSPVTGKLDSFTWKVPLKTLSATIEGEKVEEEQFDHAISSLPASSLPTKTSEPTGAEDNIERAADDKTKVPDIKTQTDSDRFVEIEKYGQANTPEDIQGYRVDDPGVKKDTKDKRSKDRLNLF